MWISPLLGLSNRRPSLFEDFPLRALRRPHHLHVGVASPLLGLVVYWITHCSVAGSVCQFTSMPCARLPSFSHRPAEAVRACSRRLAQGVYRTCHQPTRSTEFQRTRRLACLFRELPPSLRFFPAFAQSPELLLNPMWRCA